MRPLVFVDVEATAATPAAGVMTEFGAVDFVTRSTLYARLWPFTAHPQNPALPVVAADARPDVRVVIDGRELPDRRAQEVAGSLDRWLRSLAVGLPVAPTGAGVATFVSDNPAFDWMWIADLFDRCSTPNPFGFSARRIGDLAAGLAGDWRNTSSWKRYRRTVHDHQPLNDAIGNAEAFEELLRRHGQSVPGR
jgi:hypothetical protein